MDLETANGRQLVRSAVLGGLEPPPAMTVAEWAEAHRVLSSETSSEPGPWRNDRVPYAVEIMEALSPSHPCRRVVWQKGAQIGATEVGLNWIGFMVDLNPGPMLLVRPNLRPEAERFSKQRLAAMFRSCPRLRDKVTDGRSRESGNTVFVKEFPGGMLALAGANAPVGLRSMPARDLFEDETDAYDEEAGTEGDPIMLGRRAIRNFPDSKEFLCSTPGTDGRSLIAREMAETDRSRFWLPCPFCGEFFLLNWSPQMVWDKGDPSSVRQVCPSCSEGIEEHHKTRMLAGGKWIPEAPELTEEARGFYLSALYSPLGWWSWEQAVLEFEQAVKEGPASLKVFTNTGLGETWREKGERPKWERLYRQREQYPIGEVPAGGLVLTSGTDVQADRLETEIVAWGEDLESWSVDYVVIPGDPEKRETWEALDRLLFRSWPSAYGLDMQISISCVDAGYKSQEVYRYVRRHAASRVLAIHGQDNYATLIGPPRAAEVSAAGRRMKRGVKYWPVGTNLAKSELYGWLRLDPPLEDGDAYPAGFCHFPHYPPDAFQGITAEQLVPRKVRGYLRFQWEKVFERNERLDCRVYARAGAAVLGLDRYQPEDWQTIREQLRGGGSPPPDRPKRTRKRSKGGYFDRWRTP